MRTYIPYTCVGLLILLVIYLLQAQRVASDIAEANATALTDSVKYYKNQIGSETATIKTLRLNNKQLENFVLKKDRDLAALKKEFNQVHSVVKYKTETLVDTIRVFYKDSVPLQFHKAGNIQNAWYSFNYTSNQKGIVIDSLKIPNTASVITGTKRRWFLGKTTVTTDITNSNPYIKVTDIKAAEIVVQEPVHKKWYIWLAVGLAGDILSRSDQLKISRKTLSEFGFLKPSR